jgi:hypothetical protein
LRRPGLPCGAFLADGFHDPDNAADKAGKRQYPADQIQNDPESKYLAYGGLREDEPGNETHNRRVAVLSSIHLVQFPPLALCPRLKEEALFVIWVRCHKGEVLLDDGFIVAVG